MQSMGQAFGGKVVAAKEIMHGKTSQIEHDNSGVFKGLPDPFIATRYHSLAVERKSLPDTLIANAWTADGEIMGVRHTSRPIHGVQFHPESIASEYGHDMLRTFLTEAGFKL